MKNAAKTVKYGQEENLLGEPVRERISWRCGRFRAGRILNRKNKKQKERDTRVEQEDSIRKKLPGWVPCEKIERLNKENKIKYLAFLDDLLKNQSEQEQ